MLIRIGYNSTLHKADGDRVTLLKDGGIRIDRRGGNGKWIRAGYVKPAAWHWVYIAAIENEAAK